MAHRTVEATESSSDKQGVLAFMSTKKTPNSVVVLSMSTPNTGSGSGAGSSASVSCSEGQGPVAPIVEEGTAAAAEQGGTGFQSIYLYPLISLLSLDGIRVPSQLSLKRPFVRYLLNLKFLLTNLL